MRSFVKNMKNLITERCSKFSKFHHFFDKKTQNTNNLPTNKDKTLNSCLFSSYTWTFPVPVPDHIKQVLQFLQYSHSRKLFNAPCNKTQNITNTIQFCLNVVENLKMSQISNFLEFAYPLF